MPESNSYKNNPENRSPGGGKRPGLVSGWDWKIGLLVAAAVLGVVAVLWRNFGGPGPKSLSDEFDPSALLYFDPALIKFEEAARIDTRFKTVRAVAVGPSGRIYAGGDTSVRIFDKAGTREMEVACAHPPRCLAVGPSGILYVGSNKRVEVYSPTGTRQAEWEIPGKRTLLTSIALSGDAIYLADAGERTVWKFTLAGEQPERIGDKDPAKNASGFSIPSPFFDVVVAPDGLLRVANPGKHRIEAYTPEGHMELFWGEASLEIKSVEQRVRGFIGCCNPAHFAMFTNGDFVTSEKGAARVKVYDSQGDFQCVVAASGELGKDGVARDVATDRAGRVIVLDPPTQSVRVFVRKKENDGN